MARPASPWRRGGPDGPWYAQVRGRQVRLADPSATKDEARRALEERGVEFDHTADIEGYARYATFHDPDGNTVQIIEYTHAR